TVFTRSRHGSPPRSSYRRACSLSGLGMSSPSCQGIADRPRCGIDATRTLPDNVNTCIGMLDINLRSPMSTDERHTSDGFAAGMRAGMPFALATILLGIYFGVLSQSLGWDAAASVLFSILTFSGSAQFAVAAVLGAGGGTLVAILAAVILNA